MPSSPERSAPQFRSILNERPRRSVVTPLFFLALFGVGGYGGYYGYCRYQVGEKIHEIDQECQDLKQALLRADKTIRPEDVRQVVIDLAARVRVPVRPEDIQVTIEPLNDVTMKKLPTFAQTALGIAAKIPNHTRPSWIVGYKASFLVKHGVAKQVFEVERYTWHESAQP
jgi:hypothetical protein